MRAIAAVVVAVRAVGVWAEAPKPVAASTVNVVMISDIHFDPFHDPAKVSQLVAKPVTEWASVLSAASATQAEDYAALQKTCKAKGVDTPWVLLQSSLKAEQAEMPKPLFVTVSGDLMAHQFDCRFHTLVPKGSDADYSAFAAKTVEFVALQLHETFVGVPVYFALGNNDSGCKDYEEDPGSAFLKADAANFAVDAGSAKNGAAIAREFSEYGDYNIALPAPMGPARLIVLQDIFESKRYATCGGKEDASAAAAQIEWLRSQLSAAKAAHERVWVMAHIPPGIDAYSTLSKGNVCGGDAAVMFLGSTKLGDTLAEFAGTVSLGLFGHTHMDEMKLLSAGDVSVPVKVVPSITPVNGNNPAFTVAKVDAKTAMLVDYSVYAASNKTGVDTVWGKEYTYSATYAMPDFSSGSLKKLTDGFVSDKAGTSAASQAYQNFYFVGGPAELGVSANVKAKAMQMVWHGYACSMTEGSEAGFRGCVCPAKP